MAQWMKRAAVAVVLMSLSVMAACGDDDDDGTAADRLGVGAECGGDTDCLEGQTCLAFKGGYCGIRDCTGDENSCPDPDPAKCCPNGSKCVTHDDGVNYCFRICVDKPECNANRDVDNEANCSSSVTFVDGDMGRKACVPPSA